ncbi:MAG: hypothetical protein Q8940_06095 [Bacteroidota bacterium]|nr:hypothetical protein [Bacteroidota bacterium]
MKPTDIVEEFLISVEEGNFTRAEGLVSDDFQVSGVAPEPLGIREYLSVHRALNKGLSNFRFNYEIMKEKSGVVNVKIQIMGKHTDEMPSPIPGIKPIAATDIAVKMPVEHIQFNVRDQKITKMHLDHVQGGGLPGLLHQLGVEMPIELHQAR